MNEYSKKILELVLNHPQNIDVDYQVSGHAPTSATSDFLTNKAQGDWAEKLVLKAIDELDGGRYVAVPYGRSEEISAGDSGFADYYRDYQEELNRIGKRPDILLFPRGVVSVGQTVEAEDVELISKAVAAIEVRSSSFLSQKYTSAMNLRSENAEKVCMAVRDCILREPYRTVLRDKNRVLFEMLEHASAETFRELSFRRQNWHSTKELIFVSKQLKILKEAIEVLQRRDFLSITPKVEDFVLVNRWIQYFGVPHYYLQVFFDRAYIISFEDILKISSSAALEGNVFYVEEDTKNQGKTTIKIDIRRGKPIIGKIDMPSHSSVLKELERGRLLFYVKFEGGQGYIDLDILNTVFEK